MDEYYIAISDREIAKERVKKIEKRLHEQYYLTHRKRFNFMDICMALTIIFNLGAILITNALVIRQSPENIQFAEANPAHAKLNNYVTTEEGHNIFRLFIYQSILYSLVIGAYLYNRIKIFDDKSFYFTAGIVLIYITLSTYDFTNDLGYLIGKLLL